MKWKDQAITLKALRKSSGLTQDQLAAACYSKPQQVSAWERGQYPVSASKLNLVMALVKDYDNALPKAMSRDYQNELLSRAVRRLNEQI